jgi:5-methylcytosine-specific restriction endonuclease McrA
MPRSNRISKLRTEAFHLQAGLCIYCGQPMILGDLRIFSLQHKVRPRFADLFRCTAEHWVPRANGGTDSRDNIAAAHMYCNQRRHQRKSIPAPDRFRVHVRKRIASSRWWPTNFPVWLTGPVW